MLRHSNAVSKTCLTSHLTFNLKNRTAEIIEEPLSTQFLEDADAVDVGDAMFYADTQLHNQEISQMSIPVRVTVSERKMKSILGGSDFSSPFSEEDIVVHFMNKQAVESSLLAKGGKSEQGTSEMASKVPVFLLNGHQSFVSTEDDATPSTIEKKVILSMLQKGEIGEDYYLYPRGFIFSMSDEVTDHIVHALHQRLSSPTIYDASVIFEGLFQACKLQKLKLKGSNTHEKKNCDAESLSKHVRTVLSYLIKGADDQREVFFMVANPSAIEQLPVFLGAYPTAPWVFAYEDPVLALDQFITKEKKFAQKQSAEEEACAGYAEAPSPRFVEFLARWSKKDINLASETQLLADATPVQICASMIGSLYELAADWAESEHPGASLVVNGKWGAAAVRSKVLSLFSVSPLQSDEEEENNNEDSKASPSQRREALKTGASAKDVFAGSLLNQAERKSVQKTGSIYLSSIVQELDGLYKDEDRLSQELRDERFSPFYERQSTRNRMQELEHLRLEQEEDRQKLRGFVGGRPRIAPNGERIAGYCNGEDVYFGGGQNMRNGTVGYPQLFSVEDLMGNWSPDVPFPPNAGTYNSLCRFDFADPQQMAMAQYYRDMEVPFVVYNVAAVNRVKDLWTHEYLMKKFGDNKLKVEIADNNHFLFYRLKKSDRKKNKNFVPPTKTKFWTYENFLNHSRNVLRGPSETHFYFHANTFGENTQFLSEDLTYFDPAKLEDSDFFLVDKTAEDSGIHCRVGMSGVISEMHYDGGLNFISMIKGAKRYVISPPSMCANMYLDTDGPFNRHSTLRWDRVDYRKYPKVKDLRLTEVILSAGEVLYLPSYWFHHIISVDNSVQCNKRSGLSTAGVDPLKVCGF